MTTTSNRATKSTPAKSTPVKDETVKDETVSENVAPEKVVTEETTQDNSSEEIEETPALPEIFSQNPMFASLADKYLSVYREIVEYNKTVIAEKSDNEWTTGKLVAEAKKLSSPDEGEPNKDIKVLFDAFEAIQTELAKSRKALIDATAKFKGISLSSVAAERDPAKEEELKNKRVPAVDIGKNMAMMAGLVNDVEASKAIEKFLTDYALPAVGREGTRNFAQAGGSTPKYRVRVEVIKDGNVIFTGDGFAKTALALTQPVFGYERGQALKADKFREVWEASGNNSEQTKKPVVEFGDNGLLYRLTDKKSITS